MRKIHHLGDGGMPHGARGGGCRWLVCACEELTVVGAVPHLARIAPLSNR